MPSSVDYSLLNVSEKELSERRYRVTAPLMNFGDDEGRDFSGRIDLGCNAILASLDQNERERLRSNNFLDSYQQVNHRLEIHEVRPSEAVDQWNLLVQTMLLVVRESFRVLDVVLDRKVDGVWRRGGHLGQRSSTSRMYGRFPADRLSTLRNFRQGMGVDPPKQVRRALDHYENSVVSLWRGEPDNALVLGALSFESLLGNGMHSEISYRLCLRAAALVGDHQQAIFKRLKQLYGIRSGVVHGGKRATASDATHMQQALMRLIPAVAALAIECEGYQAAMDLLDARAYDDSIPAPTTVTQAGWWSFVPLAKCFERDLGSMETAFDHGRVWLFDY